MQHRERLYDCAIRRAMLVFDLDACRTQLVLETHQRCSVSMIGASPTTPCPCRTHRPGGQRTNRPDTGEQREQHLAEHRRHQRRTSDRDTCADQ